MGITAIRRDWGVQPSMVRISTTDTLADVAVTGYLTTQEAYIDDINKGAFDWNESDSVLVFADDGSGLFEISPDFTSLIPEQSGGGGGPFFAIANNLSESTNPQELFKNIGLGSGDTITIDDADFSGGLYVLTNPCFNFITVTCTTPGNTIQLPPANGTEAFSLSQGPIIIIPNGFEGIDVNDAEGALITPLIAPACEQFISTNNSDPGGSWFVRSFVSTLNTFSGDVQLIAGSGIDITDLTISATGTPSTVVSYGEMFIGPANTLPTTLNGSGQWTKVEAGPGPSPDYSFWNSGQLAGFSYANGRLTCNATASQKYNVSIAGSGFFATGGGNVATQIFTCVFANGNTTITGSSLNSVTFGTGTSTAGAVTFAMEGIFTLGNGDYLELFVKNDENAQNPIFKFATFVIEPLSTAGSAIDFTWQTITTSQSIASNNGYLTNSGSLLTLTLPSSFVTGEIFSISGVGAGGWHITQQSGQQIITENGSTTVGTGGSLQSGSGSPKDGVTMVAIDTLTLKVINSEGASIIVV